MLSIQTITAQNYHKTLITNRVNDITERISMPNRDAITLHEEYFQ